MIPFQFLKTCNNFEGVGFIWWATATTCNRQSLATRPKILLLDEPTEGIQPNIITMIGESAKGIGRRRWNDDSVRGLLVQTKQKAYV